MTTTETAAPPATEGAPGRFTTTVAPEQVTAAVAALREGGERAVLDAARRAAPVLAEHAEFYDRSAVFPARSIDAVFAEGLGALSIPAAAGGVGASLTTAARAVALLGAADASTAFLLVWQLGHLRLVDGSWSDLWRGRILAEALTGPALLNSLRVEPDLGTPARGGLPATTAERTTAADGSPAWRINGRKIYSSGSTGLRWLLVWAATTPDDPDGQRVGPFVVPGGTPGVRIVDGSWDHLGMRATVSHDVVFDDVVVPLDHAGDLQPFTGVDTAFARHDPRGDFAWITVLLSSLYVGVAKAARDWLVTFLNERKPANLGAPLASLPRFQQAIGDIELSIHRSERLIEDVARRIDADIAASATESSVGRSELGLLKVSVTRDVIAVTESAVGLIGNPGLTLHHPLQRHYRNALCSRVNAPQDDMVLGIAGRAALGVGG